MYSRWTAGGLRVDFDVRRCEFAKDVEKKLFMKFSSFH